MCCTVIYNNSFFVGRKELVQWVNTLLGMNYTKVEDCSNAVAHCYILDRIYPGIVIVLYVVMLGKVKLNQLKVDAKLEYEKIQNFKVLQAGFTKVGLNKVLIFSVCHHHSTYQ